MTASALPSIEELARRLGGTVQANNISLLCPCPVHEADNRPHNPSCLVTERKGRLIAHCRSRQCDKQDWPGFKAAFAAKAAIDESLVGARSKSEATETRYDYHWPDGTYSWSKRKLVSPKGTKDYRSGVWHEVDGWVQHFRPPRAVMLYGLRELARTVEDDPETEVLIVEGEKDCDNVRRLGLAATTAPESGKWPELATAILKAMDVKRVVIVPDNDATGLDSGVRAADALHAVNIHVRWLALPGLKPKGDISDWIEAGGTRTELERLLEEAPDYDPEAYHWQQKLTAAPPKSPWAWAGANDARNLQLALRYHPALKAAFRFNHFRQRIEVTRDLPWKALEGAVLTPIGYRPREDHDLTELIVFLSDDMGFAPFNIDTIDRAMRAAAMRDGFDEAKLWLDRLPEWDGTPRIDRFMEDYGGCTPTPLAVYDEDAAAALTRGRAYLAMLGYMIFAQVIRRIHRPGSQADHSPVLVAAQGEGKDTFYRALFGDDYLSESPPSMKSEKAADRARVLAGVFAVHDPEMTAFGNATERERKATLTKKHDRGRPAYAREHIDVPRRAIWLFSVNQREILVDPTGDRRFWPAFMEREPETAAIARDGLQLWAEAKARVAAGEPDWPDTPDRKQLLKWGQAAFRPDVFVEIEDLLDRYIREIPPTNPKPMPGESLRSWNWNGPRPAPLTALTLGIFFRRVLGLVVGVGAGKHADRKDVEAAAAYLSSEGWTLGRIRQDDVTPEGETIDTRIAWRAPKLEASGAPHVRGSMSGGRPNYASSPTPAAPMTPSARTSTRPSPENPATPGHGKQEKARKTSFSHVRGSTQLLEDSGLPPANDMSLAQNLPGRVGVEATPGHPKTSKTTLYFATVSGLDFDLAEVALTGTLCDALMDYFGALPIVSFDVETTGLTATQDRVRTAQFSDGEKLALVVYDPALPAGDALKPLEAFFRSRRMIAHQSHFEGAWLDAAGVRDAEGRDVVLDDTALLFAAVHGGGNRFRPADTFIPLSLAEIAKDTLGIDLDKSEQVGWDAEELTPAKLRYAALDAVVTVKAWDVLIDRAEARFHVSGVDVNLGYDDLRRSNALALRMERCGVLFDLAAHTAWTTETAAKAKPIIARIGEIEPMLIEDGAKALRSPKQLNIVIDRRLEEGEARDKRLARRNWPRTEKGRKLGFAKKALASVLAEDRLVGETKELVQCLHDLKALTGTLTLFGDNFRKFITSQEDGRLRGQLYAAGAVTGRYVSQKPNLQNMFESFRRFIIAPPGRSMVCSDYSQLELRVLAALSECPGMTRAFERGDDYHDAVARNVGIDRTDAKRINFGIIYGKGAETVAKDLNVDVADAVAYLAQWAANAPGATAFLEASPARYAQDRGIATARRWIDYVNDARAHATSGTRPRNYPIQGAAGDVMHKAMALIGERFSDWPGKVLPLLTIHDEIVLEADEEYAEAVARLLADAMIEAYRDVLPAGSDLHLAFGGVGKDWLSAKKHGGEIEKLARANAKATSPTQDGVGEASGSTPA